MGADNAMTSGRTTVARMKSIPTDDDAFGKGSIRADGRGVFPAYLFDVKKPSESKYPWDFYKLVHTSQPSDVLHPLNDKCKFPITA
jgi:branched-chain amino acid transport system substrate-binding protein